MSKTRYKYPTKPIKPGINDYTWVGCLGEGPPPKLGVYPVINDSTKNKRYICEKYWDGSRWFSVEWDKSRGGVEIPIPAGKGTKNIFIRNINPLYTLAYRWGTLKPTLTKQQKTFVKDLLGQIESQVTEVVLNQKSVILNEHLGILLTLSKGYGLISGMEKLSPQSGALVDLIITQAAEQAIRSKATAVEQKQRTVHEGR